MGINLSRRFFSNLLLSVSALFLLSIGVLFWSIQRHQAGNPIGAHGGAVFTKFTPLVVTHYAQNDARWTQDTIGGSGETMGRVGCAVASVSMGLSHFGVKLTPQELNNQLKNQEGYTHQGWLKWDAIRRITGGKVQVSVAPVRYATLDASLKRGTPALVRVRLRSGAPHWILVVGKEGSEYQVHDPLTPDATLRSLSNYGSPIEAVRIFDGYPYF
jgi:Peptidase_C39 like family